MLDRNKMECVGEVMSNFDHSINEVIAKRIKNEEGYGTYPAWNFHGAVYFKDNQYHCDVSTYGNFQETISEDDLEKIMNSVSEEYGWD